MLETATAMFLTLGFEATSIERLAEAASIGKATLYARYADKGALFADVIRRRILQVYEPLLDEFAKPDGRDLPEALSLISHELLQHSLSPEAIALGRILAAQGGNFPELGELAVREGLGRQISLIATVLRRFQDHPDYELADVELAADLFHAIVLGRIARLATFGVALEPSWIERRTQAAIDLFVRGIRVQS